MNVELIAMVYRSVDFLRFIEVQLQNQGVPFRIVGNDPESNVVRAGASHFEVYKDPQPDDYYLSRVYRCWNYCVESSKAEAVVLLNSDMALSPRWLEPLLRAYEGGFTPTSRLVEPGLLKPGEHALKIDIGRDPRTFPWASWRLMASDLAEKRVEPSGLFMPCVLDRSMFLEVGKYPEGNLKVDGKIISGDADLFRRMGEAGRKHVTCFDSVVYHMQEGEMRHVDSRSGDADALLEQHGIA